MASRQCSVPLCTSVKGKSKGIAFHEFPADIRLRVLWLKSIRRQESTSSSRAWIPDERSLVCQLHFESSAYVEGIRMKRLKKFVLPTKFPDFPITLQSRISHVESKSKRKEPMDGSCVAPKLLNSDQANNMANRTRGRHRKGTKRALKQQRIRSLRLAAQKRWAPKRIPIPNQNYARSIEDVEQDHHPVQVPVPVPEPEAPLLLLVTPGFSYVKLHRRVGSTTKRSKLRPPVIPNTGSPQAKVHPVIFKFEYSSEDDDPVDSGSIDPLSLVKIESEQDSNSAIDTDFSYTTQWACEFCANTFPNLVNLQEHAMARDGPDGTCINLTRFKCSYCKESRTETFCTRAEFLLHLVLHGNQEDIVTDPAHRNCPSKPKLVTCDLCFMQKTFPIGIKAHLVCHGSEDYRCRQCPGRFTDVLSFNHHCKDHKVNLCSSCGSSFKNKTELKEHIESQHPFECFYCPETFLNWNELVQHEDHHQLESR